MSFALSANAVSVSPGTRQPLLSAGEWSMVPLETGLGGWTGQMVAFSQVFRSQPPFRGHARCASTGQQPPGPPVALWALVSPAAFAFPAITQGTRLFGGMQRPSAIPVIGALRSVRWHPQTTGEGDIGSNGG